jgi:tripartite-type tricarboxylate transporter receptor subunit TctC
VKIVVSFTAGGTTDVIARKIGERLTHYWKQPVVIENKPGAGGTLGTDSSWRSPPTATRCSCPRPGRW